MAGEKRTASDLLAALGEALPKARHASFFSVLRLLERLLAGRPRIGSARSPDEELIRFRHDPSLGFNASDFSSIVLGKAHASGKDDPNGTGQREILEITSTFLGLSGSVSPLPPYFADEVAREDPYTPHRQTFLDIFHHRLVSLFYRSAVRYNLPSEFVSDATDKWSRRILSLSGVATDQFSGNARAGESVLSNAQLLTLTPLLATHVRSAHGLELGLSRILQAELADVTIKVSQFLGGWMKLGNPQRMCLGRFNCELGNTTVLGERVFDAASRVQLTIGPLTRESYERFLPDGDLYHTTSKVVRIFSDNLLEFQLELVMASGTAPGLCLLSSNPTSSLGRNTWLGQRTGHETRHYVESSPDVSAWRNLINPTTDYENWRPTSHAS